MINAPGMTSRGRMIAGLIALIVAFLLPMHVPCGYPGGTCGRLNERKVLCKAYEMEPLGFFLLEKLFGRDVGFAYRTGEDCH
jgi:hypothetical protein